MNFAFISRVVCSKEYSSDYDALLGRLAPFKKKVKVLRRIEHNLNNNLLVIDGSKVNTCKSLFEQLNSGVKIEDQLYEDFCAMLFKIANSFYETGETVVAVHWGGELDKTKCQDWIGTLLNKIRERLREKQIYLTYLSTQDENFYENLTKKDNDGSNEQHLKNALNYYAVRAVGFKNSIYEIMESILIKAYPLTNFGQSKLNPKGEINEEVKKDINKLIEVLESAAKAHSDVNDDTKSLIEILNNEFLLNEFRSKICEVLKKLPGEIYY